jgi:hypothetical protein
LFASYLLLFFVSSASYAIPPENNVAAFACGKGGRVFDMELEADEIILRSRDAGWCPFVPSAV